MYTIKNKELRNLPEQVEYLTQEVGEVKTAVDSKISKGEDISVNNLTVNSQVLLGNTEIGKDLEVDGKVKVNAPEDITFKEDNSTLKEKLDSKVTDGVQAQLVTAKNGIFDNLTAYNIKNDVNIRSMTLGVEGDDITTLYSYGDIHTIRNVMVNAPENIRFTNDLTTLADKLSSGSGSTPTLYRHTVRLYDAKGDVEEGSFCFTAYSTKSKEINDWDSLTEVFSNTDIQGTGIRGIGATTNVYNTDFLFCIHIGTSQSESFYYNYLGEEESVSAVKTIEDTVSQVF